MADLRRMAAPFVAAAPTGARVRTRLRVSAGTRRCCGRRGRTWGRWPGVTWRHGARRGGWTRRTGGVAGGAEAGTDRRSRRRGGRARSPGPARSSGSSPTGTCARSGPACGRGSSRSGRGPPSQPGGSTGRREGTRPPAERHAKDVRLQALSGPAVPGSSSGWRRWPCQ